MQIKILRNDRVAQRARASKLSIGDTLVRDLSQRGFHVPNESSDPLFCQFIHALNTSDWLTAAYFLHGEGSHFLDQTRSRDNLLVSSLASHSLDPLYRAADRFHQDRNEWQSQLQQAYQFGKLPAYGPRIVDGKTMAAPYARNSEVVEHGRNLTRMIPLFQEYEKINQLYQTPGHTSNGAAIRFTQGHNWSFGHMLTDILSEKNFPADQRRILVNWDAHRDLSSPFGHLAREMALLMQWMQIDQDRLLWLIRNAQTPEQIAEVTSMISIAGWILPLLYSRVGTKHNFKEIVLVVPREAMETSDNLYWPSYGTHSITVGQTFLDDQQLATLHQVIEKNKLYQKATSNDNLQKSFLADGLPHTLDTVEKNTRFKSLQSSSTDSNLGTLHDDFLETLQNANKFKVHIVNPDQPDSFRQHLQDAQIHLSVDVDFAGTTHLGGWYSKTNPSPHYPLNHSPGEELRHQELIERFKDFYQSNSDKIRGVSVASSPDYTAEETRRLPAAKIFNILTNGSASKQPSWITRERTRFIPPQLQKNSSRHLLISLAGILGVSITGALYWHYTRRRNNQNDPETRGA